jgi:tetratricopeptide (TPR) repeat protein
LAVPAQTELWLLERLSDSGLDGLDDCVAAGVIEAHGSAVRFRHELARLAFERELGVAQALALHRRVLRELEQAGAEPSRLVHHAQAAGDGLALLRHAVVAGARSAELGAHCEAAAHYRRAIAVSNYCPAREQAELLGRLAFELYLTDRLKEAIDVQPRSLLAMHGGDDRVGEGDALRRLSRLLWFGGHGEEAKALAGQAVAVLETSPEGPELARAYSNVSQLRMLAGDNEPAIAWGERALALAERIGALEVAVHGLANIGSAETLAGREREGRAKIEESLRRGRLAGLDDDVGRAYANLGATAAWRRQLASADRSVGMASPTATNTIWPPMGHTCAHGVHVNSSTPAAGRLRHS